MLDVHSPHEPTHSWTDFFIHIATICVGLLIAVGLEQAVEAIHHHHQREFLEEQMLHEAEENLKLIPPQIEYSQQLIGFLLLREKALTDAPADAPAFASPSPPTLSPCRTLPS